jgi:hypothetical protein
MPHLPERTRRDDIADNLQAQVEAALIAVQFQPFHESDFYAIHFNTTLLLSRALSLHRFGRRR